MPEDMDYKNFCLQQYNEIYAQVYDTLLDGRISLNARTNCERQAQHIAILTTFKSAYDLYRDEAGAADIWNAIYSAHMRRKAGIDQLTELTEEVVEKIISAAQSWKKSSGHVFEEYVVRATEDRLSEHCIKFVLQKELTQLLKEGKIGNEADDNLENLVKSENFDIYAIVDVNGIYYVFGCIQAKTSIRDRVGRDRDFSIPIMDKHFWSVAVALDGAYLNMPKFEHMVNGGGETQYAENGWHGMYSMSNAMSNDRIYYDGNLELLIEHSQEASRKFISARQRFDHSWKALE